MINRSTPSGDVRVGLAYVGLSRSVGAVLEHLAFARLRATFFVPPHQLVSEAVRWRRVVEEGHELGNSALMGVTDNGRLRNWDLEAIGSDLHDTNRLLKELGMNSVDSIFLPGRFHVCAEGRYRRFVQQDYAVCLSDAPQATALNGCPGEFEQQSLSVRTRLIVPSVVVVKGDVELGTHSRMLVRMAKYATGPVRALNEAH
jgi:hypothetical protein